MHILSTDELAQWTPVREAEFAARYPRSWGDVKNIIEASRLAHKRPEPAPEPPPLPAPVAEYVIPWAKIRPGATFLPAPRSPRVETIAYLCAEAAGIGIKDIISPRRATHVVRARQCAAWLAKKHTSQSFPSIGKALGGRDHSTAMHSVRRTEERLQANDEETKRLISYVTRRLGLDGEDGLG